MHYFLKENLNRKGQCLLLSAQVINCLLNSLLKTHHLLEDSQTSVVPFQSAMTGLEMEKEFYLDNDDWS